MNTCIRGMYILSRSSMYKNIPKHTLPTQILNHVTLSSLLLEFFISFSKRVMCCLLSKMLFKAGCENFSLRNLGAEITVKNHIG